MTSARADALLDAERTSSSFRVRQLLVWHVTPVFLPILTLVATAIASANHGWTRVYWYSIAGAAILAAGVLNVFKQRQADRFRSEAVSAKAALSITLADSGQPLISQLGTVTSSFNLDEIRSAVDTLMNRTVALARSLSGRNPAVACATRAVFYELQDRRLVRRSFEGRAGEAPRPDFLTGRSDHDNEVVRLAQGEKVLVVDDLAGQPPPHFIDPVGRTYKSFIAVPVRAGRRSFGLLIADSDKPRSLGGEDKGFLILLAGILAAGLAHLHSWKQLGPAPKNSTNGSSNRAGKAKGAPQPGAGR